MTRSNSATGRYLGLVRGMAPSDLTLSTRVIRPAEALVQLQAEAAAAANLAAPSAGTGSDPGAGADLGVAGRDGGTGYRTGGQPGQPGQPTGLVDEGNRVPRPPAAVVFRGAVSLDPHRPVKGFGDLSKEVLDHLASQVGAEVEVRVERSLPASWTASPTPPCARSPRTPAL